MIGVESRSNCNLGVKGVIDSLKSLGLTDSDFLIKLEAAMTRNDVLLNLVSSKINGLKNPSVIRSALARVIGNYERNESKPKRVSSEIIYRQ